MEKLIINGGHTLRGTVKINGAKNAVLPIIAATLLSKEKCQIQNAPNLTDVHTICAVLRHLGAEVQYVEEESTINTETKEITTSFAPYEYVRSMRASFLVMGPLLARTGRARISLPGGCAIGTRPIDLHLKGFKALGAKINYCQGYIEAKAEKLQGNQVYLDFPSVGATENILMAATLAEGKSTIENAAEEPEIVDLANFLNYMGAKIKGAGTRVIRIEGVEALHGAQYAVIPDRIEAATYMVAAAITGGEVEIQSILVDHLKPVEAKLQETGVILEETPSGLKVISQQKLNGADIKTMPYPGFPTDMQPQMMALLSVATGTSVINESVFENRFMHVNELKRMGAQIKTEGHIAVIEGVKHLSGAHVKATDLRAAAALIIAGLAAKGETVISNLQHLDRGYANIEENLRQLGAKIQRVKE